MITKNGNRIKQRISKHLYVGSHVFINYIADFLDGVTITIGDQVMIGPDVKMYSGNHPLIPSERMKIVVGKLQLRLTR